MNLNPNHWNASLSLFETHTRDLKATLASLQEKILSVEQSQQRAASILSHIHDALLLIDFNGIILECNKAITALFPLPLEELLGSSFWDHFDDTLFGFSVQELLEKRTEKKHLILTLLQNDQTKQIEVNTALIPEVGLVLILRDRSEIKRLEESLKENIHLKALGEMAATLAHEIRNPLGGIHGFASLLLEDLKTMPAQKKMVEAILEGTNLLNSLVTNVLEYARPCQMNFTSVNIKKLLEKELLYLSPQGRERVEILCPVDCSCIVDEKHFARALLNLIQNGLEASEAPQKVSLYVTNETVIIQDRGCGIPPEHLEKVMTPFFSTKTKGTGLGLSEVHKILKAHGFPYQIDSSDQGTSVTIFYGGNI